MDTTDNSSKTLESTLTFHGDISAGIHICLVSVLSIFGNVLLLFISTRNRSLKPIDKLIMNIAISDLLTGLFGYPLAMISSFKHRWSFGDAGCHWYSFIAFTSGTVSMVSFAAVAYFRYIKIVRTGVLFPGRASFNRQVNITVVFSWIYALLWSSFPFLGWGKYGPEPFHISCTIDWASDVLNVQVYVMSAMVWVYLLPLSITIWSYVSISHKLCSHQRQLEQRSWNRSRSARFRTENRLMITSLVATVCFMISWTPYAIVAVSLMFLGGHDALSPTMSFIPAMLAKTSSFYNPVIYLIFNKKFRNQARDLVLRCGCKMCNHEINVTGEALHVHSTGFRIYTPNGATYKVKYNGPLSVEANQPVVEAIPMRYIRRQPGAPPIHTPSLVKDAIADTRTADDDADSKILILQSTTGAYGDNDRASKLETTISMREELSEYAPMQLRRAVNQTVVSVSYAVTSHPFGVTLDSSKDG